MNIKKGTVLGVFIIIGIIIYMINYRNKQEIVIEFGMFSGNEWGVPQNDVYKIYDEGIANFEKMHKNVKVVYRSGTLMGDYSEWLAQKILTDKEPDVFIVMQEDFNTLASIGMLENLDNHLKKDPSISTDEYYNKALDAGQYEHIQYALPMEIVPTFMIVNKTLLDLNDIKIPDASWTINDFYEICKKVTKDTDNDGFIDQFGVYGYDWDNVYYGADKTFVKGSRAVDIYDEQQLTKAIDFTKSLYQLNRGQVVNQHDYDAGTVAFKTFTLDEYRAYRPYPYRIKKYSDFEWETIPFPRVNNESHSKLYTVQMGMSSRSKQKALAWEFIKYMTNSDEIQKKVWEYTYTLPTKTDVVEKIYAENQDVEDILNADFLQNIIDQSVIEPTFKSYTKIKESMDIRISSSILGQTSTRDTIRALRQDVDEILQLY